MGRRMSATSTFTCSNLGRTEAHKCEEKLSHHHHEGTVVGSKSASPTKRQVEVFKVKNFNVLCGSQKHALYN